MSDVAESRAALEAELLGHVPALRAYARSLARNYALADDLVQETILKAWSNLHQFQLGTNLRAWLFTIQRNVFYSMMNKRKREVQDSDGVFADALIQQPQQDVAMKVRDFKHAFAQLPLDQREVLTLIAAGVSYEDAAKICDCAMGTIKSRLNRARRRLGDLLDGEVPADTPPANTRVAA